MILLDSYYHFGGNEVLFVKIGVRVLDLWLDTCFGSNMPQTTFYAPNPKVEIFFKISQIYCIHLTILEKMRSCLWKLELGFSNNGLLSSLPKALGPNYPKPGFRPQTPNVRVLRSEKFFMSSSITFCIK